MDPLRFVARSALGAVFITGGIDALRSPDRRAELAAPVIEKARETIDGLPDSDVRLVRINAGVHVVAGSLLVLGRLPRTSALVLAASLVPTTLGGHRFWEAESAQDRAQQRLHFSKNLAMFGGLLFAVLDRGGRPSLVWRTKRLAGDAGDELDHLASTVDPRRLSTVGRRGVKAAARAVHG